MKNLRFPGKKESPKEAPMQRLLSRRLRNLAADGGRAAAKVKKARKEKKREETKERKRNGMTRERKRKRTGWVQAEHKIDKRSSCARERSERDA